MKVTVEFMGLPASGKSTVIDLTVAELAKRGAPARLVRGSGIPEGTTPDMAVRHLPTRSRRTSRALSKARILATQRRLVWIVARVLMASPRGLHHRLFTLRRVLTTLQRWSDVEAAHMDDEIWLFDEALLQHAYLVFIDARGSWSSRDLSEYVGRARVADLVVHLRISSRGSQRRQLHRATQPPPLGVPISRRFAGLDPGEYGAVLDVGASLLQHLADQSRASATTRVIELDAEKDPHSLACAVANVAVELCRQDENRRGKDQQIGSD